VTARYAARAWDCNVSVGGPTVNVGGLHVQFAALDVGNECLGKERKWPPQPELHRLIANSRQRARHVHSSLT
jgi:hypothetical protein